MSYKLDDLLEEAKRAYDSLSPEEQAEHRRAQTISFVTGNLALDRPDVPIEKIRALVTEAFDARE